jgi:hypothetical protein
MSTTPVARPHGPAELPGAESLQSLAPRTMPTALQGIRPTGASTFDELYRLAQVCQASGLFEDIKDASQAMVKIVKGAEMGIPPTAAMAAFDIIAKRLFIKPWAIAAKINTCGYGSYEIQQQTDEACTILFARKYPGRGWRDCPPVTFTFVEAKARGLVERSPHWKASPAHMLYQRAMGRGGAMYFPELLAGLEPPQDDTPIPPERHQKNLTDLFSEGGGGYVHQREPAREVSRTGPGTTQGARRDTIAWETLTREQANATLPTDLLERIHTALSTNEPATDSEAFVLADEVLGYLDHQRETQAGGSTP